MISSIVRARAAACLVHAISRSRAHVASIAYPCMVARERRARVVSPPAVGCLPLRAVRCSRARMAGVERFSKTARNYDSNKSPTLDPTVNACKQLPWVRVHALTVIHISTLM